MPTDAVFRGAFFVLIIGLIVIRSYYALKARALRHVRMVNRREGTPIALLRTVMGLGVIAFLLVYAFLTQWLGWSELPLPAWLRWIGVGLNVVSLALLVWVHATLGRNWSSNLELQRNHTLVTSGPYALVRHPMYTVLILWGVSIILVAASWLLGVLFLIFAIWLLTRAGREEAMMLEHFGEEYRRYMQHTGRFMPRMSF